MFSFLSFFPMNLTIFYLVFRAYIPPPGGLVLRTSSSNSFSFSSIKITLFNPFLPVISVFTYPLHFYHFPSMFVPSFQSYPPVIWSHSSSSTCLALQCYGPRSVISVSWPLLSVKYSTFHQISLHTIPQMIPAYQSLSLFPLFNNFFVNLLSAHGVISRQEVVVMQ